MTPENYDKAFFQLQHDESYRSAKEILPMVISVTGAKKVLDVGCGSGAWLKAYDEITGSKDYLGVDGSYIDRSSLLIEDIYYLEKDLEYELNLGDKFDLVISLEVAEHLHKESANIFIKSLINHSDTILFSAAIPGQEGTKHYNEQFPEYWQTLFRNHGYICLDIFRDKIWDKENIPFWYKQNILLFITENNLEKYKPFIRDISQINSNNLTRIHPSLWEYKLQKLNYYESISHSIKKFISYKILNKRVYR